LSAYREFKFFYEIVINTLIEKPRRAVAELIMLEFGLPVYYYWKNKNIKA